MHRLRPQRPGIDSTAPTERRRLKQEKSFSQAILINESNIINSVWCDFLPDRRDAKRFFFDMNRLTLGEGFIILTVKT